MDTNMTQHDIPTDGKFYKSQSKNIMSAMCPIHIQHDTALK